MLIVLYLPVHITLFCYSFFVWTILKSWLVFVCLLSQQGAKGDRVSYHWLLFIIVTKCQWMQTGIVFPIDSHLYSVISDSKNKVVNTNPLIVFFFYLFHQRCNSSLFMREKSKKGDCPRQIVVSGFGFFVSEWKQSLILFILFPLQGPQGERVSTERKILQLLNNQLFCAW